MVIGSSTPYRLGTKFSLAQMFAESVLGSGSRSRTLLGSTSLRSTFRRSDAYDVLLSQNARRSVALRNLENSKKTGGQKLVDDVLRQEQGRTKAEDFNIRGKELDYLKKTLPGSYLVKTKYERISRAEVAQSIEELYKRLDEGLSKVNVKARDTTGLELTAENAPSWLKFDATTGTFFGTPPEDFSGELEVVLRATLPDGRHAEDTITLNFLRPDPDNRAPYVTRSLQYLVDAKSNQPLGFATTGKSYSVTIPERFFNDDDENDEIQVRVRLKGEGRLGGEQSRDSVSVGDRKSSWPSWLTYHPQLRTFSGTPPAGEAGKTYDFVVTAQDKSGARVSSEFTLRVLDGEDAKADNVRSLPHLSVGTDRPFSYLRPFSDVFDGSHRVKASLLDGKPLPSWLKFSVDTVDPPSIKKVIPPQAFSEDKGFLKRISLNDLLEDEGEDRYKVTATLSSGGGTPGALPSWLEFDDKTNILSVKDDASPPPGVYEVHLQIDDVDDGYTVHTSFKLTVNGPGVPSHVPEGKVALEDLAFPRALLPTRTLPDGTVKDPNKIALPAGAFGEEPPGGFIYRLTKKDGSPAPSWVTLQNGYIVKGAAPASMSGEKIELLVTAEHPVTGHGASLDFSLEILPEDVEVVRVPLPGTLYTDKTGDKLALPKGLFAYEKPEDLRFSARLAGGGSLPHWLKFDADAQSFSLDKAALASLTGSPRGDYRIEVKARDPNTGKEAMVVFSLGVRGVEEIAPKPQAKSGGLKGRMKNDGSSQTFFLGEDLFTEPEEGESYSYELLSRDGSPLPTWLSFDATTMKLTGTPPSGTPEEDFDFVLVAKDARGEAASVDVELSLMSRDPIRKLKLYGDPRGEDVGNYYIMFEAGHGKESARSLMGLSLTKTGGVLPGISSVSPLPGMSVDQNDELSAKYRIGDHFSTDYYGTKYVVRQKNGAPVPPWMKFSTTTDQKPLVKKQLSNIALVKGDKLQLKMVVDPKDLIWDEPSDEIKVSATLAGGGSLPSWLSFDEKTNTLSITDKDAAVAGSYTIRYSFSDETDGHVVTLDQELHIHPKDTKLTPPSAPEGYVYPEKLVSRVGESIDLKFSSRFGNPKSGDSFTYEVTMVDGSPLPTWLRHDASNPGKLELVGTPPPIESSEVFSLSVRAINSQGVEARMLVPLTVFKEGIYFKEDEKAVSLYSDGKDEKFSVRDMGHYASFPKDWKEMDVSATLSGGGSLPSWLSFDEDKGEFEVDKSAVTAGDYGVHDIDVTVKDPVSGLSDTLRLKVYMNDPANRKDPPKVSYGVPRVAMRLGVPGSVTLKSDVFEAPPAGESYSYDVRQANGDSLPSWLSYDPATKTFSGTPPLGLDLKKSLDIKVTVRDARGAETKVILPIHFTDRDEEPKFVIHGKPEKQEDVKVWDFEITAINKYGEEATSDFSVTVNDVNVDPKVTASIEDRSLSQGEKFEIDLKDHFVDAEEADPDDSHLLSYSLAMRDGSAVPSWLTLDNTKKSISATIPESGAVGDYGLVLTVTAPGGRSISRDVNLKVTDNHAPRFIRDFGLQTVGGGGRKDLTLDGFVLSDFDGSVEDLSFRLEATDKKSKVPGWVKVDEGARKLSIEPPQGVSGFYKFDLVAKDKRGAEVRQEVSVYVGGDEKPSLSFTSGKVNLESGKAFRFSVPSYGFSIPEGESVRYEMSESSGMTSYDVKGFKVLSELVWDEILGATKYREGFDYVDAEHVLRIGGYLAAMDVLAGGDGKLEDFRYIRNKLPYLDRSLFDQELLSIRDRLPLDRVEMDRTKALKLVELALDKGSRLEGRAGEDASEAKKGVEKVQEDIDELLGIDMAALRKSREVAYTPIGDSTARARESMKVLVKYIFDPVLGEKKSNNDKNELSLDLSRRRKDEVNAVYKMLIRNMAFGADTPTVDKIPDYEKRMIGGLMRTLDYLTGGDGKGFDFAHFIEKLPKENRQYGEKYLAELGKLFEVDKAEILGKEKDAFASIARISAEYNAYLSLPEKTQKLHTKRMQELQYQMENMFKIRNSPTAQALIGSRGVNYAALLGGSVSTPASFLSTSLSGGGSQLLTQGAGGLFGTSSGSKEYFGESGNSSALRLLGGG